MFFLTKIILTRMLFMYCGYTILIVSTLTSVDTVTDVRGCQERGGVELLLNTLFGNIEIAGEQVHTKMTLILDKDTGNTEDL